ncbi:UdgX family uracil-DNA binding protein [Streptomyces sp. S07_1.15]|uniref:UdgX family uracil-DNA binding protein n=1 Tax=Streptomyces sp. S07_1.15 TaxID=2873925 RepID=UPI001D1528AB|nr:UdgX family uracil-DNA binding protein [Streptomyces sp. S07_1.15]MCC3652409.1 UdgX family uracil-DNA binding protein [Streptomyces sp. S07_1.15]
MGRTEGTGRTRGSEKTRGGGTARGSGGAGGGGGPEERYDAAPFVPRGTDLAALRESVAGCRGCPLHRDATQAVFGRGDASARIVLLGEQPGDQEDRRGEPFVGPAGRVLDEALAEAGVDPGEAYVTNAVKHFKFERRAERGKRRIHKPPTLREMTACRPWLAAELELLDPEVIVALGATAGKALLGSAFRVTKERGRLLTWSAPEPEPGPESGDGDGEGEGRGGRADGGKAGGAAWEGPLVATIHPSAVLRAEDDREAVRAGLVADLRIAAGVLDG